MTEFQAVAALTSFKCSSEMYYRSLNISSNSRLYLQRMNTNESFHCLSDATSFICLKTVVKKGFVYIYSIVACKGKKHHYIVNDSTGRAWRVWIYQEELSPEEYCVSFREFYLGADETTINYRKC